MKINTNWQNYIFIIIIIAPIQYIILSSIAMFFYSGGTLDNQMSFGYNFWNNFFSDLGRFTALSGEPNYISFIIFTFSALIMSISLILFVISLYRLFQDKNQINKYINLGSIFGLITAFFLILTVLTPWDLFPSVHLMFSYLFNFFGAFTAFFYFLVIINNQQYCNRYGFLFLFLLLLAIFYIFLYPISSIFFDLNKISIQATYQKISQYAFLLCYCLQGIGALKYKMSN
ncbi:MAG: hypothetical protein JXA99_07410 [Candidatus Lokiarchaeota archaeon]|nr:hypothetical protein [Candidatus Lokiarchaeota archaeon]